MKKVLHLMVNNTCHNDCTFCCNKQYNVDDIPVVTIQELKDTETICITGGEPFIDNNCIAFLYKLISSYPNIKTVYIYTSAGWLLPTEINKLILIQKQYNVEIGLSLSPKSFIDRFKLCNHEMAELISKLGHCRFYCFTEKDTEIAKIYYNFDNIEIIERKWQKKFTPAENTIFRRLPIWI